MGFTLLAVAIAGLAGWVFSYFSDDQQIRRMLRNAPAKRIKQLREDELGKVVGRARSLAEMIAAPLTGRRCMYFVATVEERHTKNMISSWKTVIREERGVPFMLEDESGRALVDATAARIAIDFDGKSQSGMSDDPTEVERALLTRHGQEGEGVVFNRTLRYREAVIEDGKTIAVFGAGTREPDPDAPPTEAYRGDAPTRLRLTSSRKYPLVICDDPAVTGTRSAPLK